MRNRFLITIAFFLYTLNCVALLDSTFLLKVENTVKNHIEYNTLNDGKGNFFIYISESKSSEPTTNFTTTDWLREDPLGITPYATTIRSRLQELNDRNYIDDNIGYNGKIQHYFIVVEVDLYNALNFPEYQNKVAEKKITFSGVDSYNSFEQLVANEIALKVKHVSFDGVFENANTLHTTSLLVVGKKIVDNRIQAKFNFTYIGKKNEPYIRLRNFWNTAIPEVDKVQGFEKLIKSLDLWEKHIFGTIPPSLTCPSLGLQVTSTIASSYITARCTLLTEENLDNKKQALVDIAKFIDLLFYMKTHYAGSDFADNEIGDIESRWFPYCDIIFNAYKLNANQNFNLWLRFNYKSIEVTASETLSPSSDILRKLFMEEFFLLDQPLQGTLLTNLTTSVSIISAFPNWFIPVREFCLRTFNDVFKWLNNGTYHTLEKQAVINSLISHQGIENILYNKILNPSVFDPLWGELNALSIAENMAKIVSEVKPIPNPPKYIPIAASEEYLNSKTYGGTNPLLIGYGLVNNPSHTFPNNNGKLDLNFEVCAYQCQGISCLASLIWEPCEFSLGSYKSKDLDFFEIITPVFLNNPSYFDISCNGQTCTHKGFHEPAFLTLTKIRTEKLNETVSDVGLTVSIVTLPLTGIEVAAATGIMRLVHGIWFTSEVLSVTNTVFETQIENKFKESLGNDVGSNYFQKYKRGVDLVAISSIFQLTNFQKYLVNDLTDIAAVGRVSDDFLSDTGANIPGIETPGFRILGEEVQNDLLIRIVNESENITTKHKQWYDLAPEIDILASSHSNLRKLINRGRHLVTDANTFTPISQYLRGLSNAEIAKLVDDLNANPGLIDFFAPIATNGTRSAQVIERRLRAWRLVNNYAERSKDILLLTKIDEILENENLLTILGGELGLKTIIQKHLHAPCCGGTHSYLKSIDKYLKDVVDFVDEFGPPNPTEGFANVIQGMKTNEWVSESIDHMFNVIKDNPTLFNKSEVTNFDNTFVSIADEGADISCAGCKFDIEAGGKRYELKSYGKPTVDNIASGNIKNQHRAYIETGTLDDTRYLFNKLKLTGPFVVDGVTLTGTDAAAQYVRSKFLKMYQTNAQYFWTNGSMAWWQNVFPNEVINNADDLLDLLNGSTYSSAWLNFIKVQ